MKNKVLVVGAGIFGMTTSIELAKLGMNVTLHE
jgi:2-polyprenyl-6-methoxyphenol hydroxylase-like FAD-dependent oxidoreductase